MPRDSSENFHFASFHIDAEIIHFGPTNSQKNRVQWKTLQADKIAIFVNDKIWCVNSFLNLSGYAIFMEKHLITIDFYFTWQNYKVQ